MTYQATRTQYSANSPTNPMGTGLFIQQYGSLSGANPSSVKGKVITLEVPQFILKSGLMYFSMVGI